MESEISRIREWLSSQEIEYLVYKSHKAAIISSSDPFGLFGAYRNSEGAEYFYVNGVLESIEYDGKTIRY